MKSYRSHGQLILPVRQGDDIVYCEFTDAGNTFNTNNKEIQEYIENSTLFASGDIILFSESETTNEINEHVETKREKELTVFLGVATINQAKDILRAEPYNVNHQKLRTPEAIMAQAIEHSVAFPNWTN